MCDKFAYCEHSVLRAVSHTKQTDGFPYFFLTGNHAKDLSLEPPQITERYPPFTG